ncbi:MAG: prepilin-type N-terminal cleavage/methylation domain-containing protein [Candidatus Pacebacteria bacterium]|nr:prepilin-type N-terminal cleavage/methylation domain-containing protein [Candidatus Paceibacterota bacterium]
MADKEKGYSLIELMIAMGVLALSVSAITFLTLDSYISLRSGQEETRAVFLAQEGLEAARAIRDDNWDSISNGSHGLAFVSGKWQFFGEEENISDKLSGGTRKIEVEQIDEERKKITSSIFWDFSSSRPREVSLSTYFSNWRQTIGCAEYCISEDYLGGVCRQDSDQCVDNGEIYASEGDSYCSGPPDISCCCESLVTITSCAEYCVSEGYSDGVCRRNSRACSRNGEIYSLGGDDYCSAPRTSCCCDP